MKFLKQKKSKFDNITNILFETQEKKKLLKLVFLMLIGMSLELFGVGLIFPALKLLTDNEFLSKTYNFFNIDELDTKILLLSIVSTFIIFGFKVISLIFLLIR